VASRPKRATVYHRPGVGVRWMETVRWLGALGFLVVMFGGIWLFSRSGKSIATLGIPASIVVFVGFLYWARAMGDRAERSADRALDARRGAVAEEEVGNLLGELPAGFFIVHDFASNRGNIDHIVVSSKGILTVETKSHRGVVACEGERLTRDGEPFEKDFIRQAWAQAYLVRDLLAGQRVAVPKPQPVILFANADVRVRRPVRGVEIVGRSYFPLFLRRLPGRMDARSAKLAFEALKASQSQMFV
jgi:Nuclease-related domain